MAADSGFAGRLAYVRWLRARGRVAPETDREFAEALGVTYGWLAKWKIRPDAPDGRTETRSIEQALAPMGVTGEWLFDDAGSPPEPALWRVWAGEDASHAPHQRALKAVAEPPQKYEGPPMYWGEPVAKKPAAKKVAEGGKKKR